MTNVKNIYEQLAVRINYPIKPTYRCLQKIIGNLNILISLSNTPQVTIEVPLSGEPNNRYYEGFNNEKISFLKDGRPCKLNPDGTIHTKDDTAYVIRDSLFTDLDTNRPKKFVTSDTDVLADDYYLQPILTSLFLMLQGVQPSEAVMYINDACTKSNANVDTRQVDMDRVRRRL